MLGSSLCNFLVNILWGMLMKPNKEHQGNLIQLKIKEPCTLFIFSVNASRECLENGTWNRLTNYNNCMKALHENVVCDEEDLDRSVSFYIYLAGDIELRSFTVMNAIPFLVRLHYFVLGTELGHAGFPLIQVRTKSYIGSRS